MAACSYAVGCVVISMYYFAFMPVFYFFLMAFGICSSLVGSLMIDDYFGALIVAAFTCRVYKRSAWIVVTLRWIIPLSECITCVLWLARNTRSGTGSSDLWKDRVYVAKLVCQHWNLYLKDAWLDDITAVLRVEGAWTLICVTLTLLPYKRLTLLYAFIPVSSYANVLYLRCGLRSFAGPSQKLPFRVWNKQIFVYRL